jgi:hypothetical protein
VLALRVRERAVAAKVSHHALDRPLEDLAHFACLEVTELLANERGVVLVRGAVEEDHVKERVEPEVRRGALHDLSHPLK